MNPVAKFEESARTIWRSDLSLDEKAKRLKAVRAAVLHYVKRLEGAAASDPWDACSLDRMRSYLKALAADAEDLALRCERPPLKTAPKLASGPYAA